MPVHTSSVLPLLSRLRRYAAGPSSTGPPLPPEVRSVYEEAKPFTAGSAQGMNPRDAIRYAGEMWAQTSVPD